MKQKITDLCLCKTKDKTCIALNSELAIDKRRCVKNTEEENAQQQQIITGPAQDKGKFTDLLGKRKTPAQRFGKEHDRNGNEQRDTVVAVKADVGECGYKGRAVEKGGPEIGTDAVDQGESTLQRLRPEKDPGKRDQTEGDNPLDQVMQGGMLYQPRCAVDGHPQRLGQPSDDVIDSMQQTPDQKGQPSAMPQTTDQKDNQSIAAGARYAAPTAAQWDVKIVLKPA